MYKAVLFDLDCTLYEGGAKPGFGEKFDAAMQKERSKIKDPHFIEKMNRYFDVWGRVEAEYSKDENEYNGDLWDLRNEILARELNITIEEAKELSHKVWYDFIGSIYRRIQRLSPKTLPLLHSLKKSGYKVGLITEMRSGFKLKALGLEDFDFDAIVEAEKLGVSKPHSKAFLEALRKLGCRPEEALLVGDDARKDIVGANKLGITSVLINRGRYDVALLEGLEKPDFCISELDEILKILNGS